MSATETARNLSLLSMGDTRVDNCMWRGSQPEDGGHLARLHLDRQRDSHLGETNVTPEIVANENVVPSWFLRD